MTDGDRNPAVDALRLAAAVIIVVGHWLAASVTFRDDRFGVDNVLGSLPWTQWLTLLFQVVPLFFLVAGYANTASWVRSRGDQSAYNWMRQRLARTLGPTATYAVLVLSVVALLEWCRVNPSQVAFGAWAVSIHLWFVPVYLVVVSVTPLAVAAQRRWGTSVPVALATGVGIVDVVSLIGWLPGLGLLNYVLCWACVYQLGIAWYLSRVTTRRTMALAVGALVTLVVLIGFGPYPLSMVGLPGADIQNTSPPTIAMLAFAGVQAGIVMSVTPRLCRSLRNETARRRLSLASRNVMMLYLWHMVPVVAVALVGYPTGLLPQPALGTAAWWVTRLGWVAILTAVTVAELTVLWRARKWLAGELPAVAVPLPRLCATPLLAAGGVLATLALYRIAAEGFTTEDRIPWSAFALIVGVALVCLQPVGTRRRRSESTNGAILLRRPNTPIGPVVTSREVPWTLRRQPHPTYRRNGTAQGTQERGTP